MRFGMKSLVTLCLAATAACQAATGMAELMDESHLFDRGSQREYRGENLGAIRLPVGGIAAGSIQIDGTAARPIWQIFNNYSQVAIPNSFFAVRCSIAGEPPLMASP